MTFRVGGTAAAMVAGVLSLGAPLQAQNPSATRSAVTVDYVGVDGIYLPVGADQGLVLGDTVAVFGDAGGAQALGHIVLSSVTRRRSVGQPVEASLAIARGDVIYFGLAETTVATPAAPGPSGPSVRATPLTPRAGPAEPSGPRVSGHFAVDVDARETRTSWSGDLFGETTRRFATPTSRLSLTVADLPGGLTIRTNVRAAYRYDDLPVGPPPVSVRAYEAVVTKSFSVAEVMLGRFSNPYESYSAYWDGLLLRVGRERGPGIGVVAGYEPSLYNERPSTALPKITGFADLALRGSGWRYRTDVSVHYLRPSDGSKWSYAGWTQRVSIGPLDFSQRLRLDGGIDGRSLEIGDLRLRARLELAGTLGVHGGYGRTGSSALPPGVRGDALTLPYWLVEREEISAGLDVSRGAGSLWIDAGQSTRVDQAPGRFVSGNAALPLAGSQLLLSGRYWRRDAQSSVGASPALAFGLMGMRLRLAYRFYHTDSGLDDITTHAVGLHTAWSVGRSIGLTAGAEHQWGSNLAADRVSLGFSRSF